MNQRKLLLQLQHELQAHLRTDQEGNISGIEESAQACADVFGSVLSTLMQEIEQRIQIHQSKALEYRDTARHSLRLASEGKVAALQELRSDLSILYASKATAQA
jgi:hypothetical protein